MACGDSNGSEPAAAAMQSFSHGDYAGCLRLLSALPAADPRVEHNRALAELMASGTRGGERYRVVVSKQLGAIFPHAELPPAALRRPHLVYNYAVLLFHARHYRQAADLLARLAESQIDKELKRRTLLLLAEAHLCRRAAQPALQTLRSLNDTQNPLAVRMAARARIMAGEPTDVSDASGVEALVLAAHARLAGGDRAGAAALLARHDTATHAYTALTQGEDVWPALNNDLGVVQLALGRPALAAKYFQVAMKEQVRGAEGEAGTRLCAVRDRPLYVHNLGLALLEGGRPAPAFDCLVEAARHYPSNPRLWRRLADCCVRHVAPDSAAAPQVVRYGAGAHTRAALTSAPGRRRAPPGESFAIPTLSLEFAALCLRNALVLLARGDALTPAPPGNPLTAAQRSKLRLEVLALHSYVLLELDDPLSALRSAEELARDAPPPLAALACAYAAEALLRLDRPVDAAERLQPPNHRLLAQQVYATAAACQTLRGDAVTARKIVSQLEPARTLPLRLYLEMAAGDVDAARALLRNLRVAQ